MAQHPTAHQRRISVTKSLARTTRTRCAANVRVKVPDRRDSTTIARRTVDRVDSSMASAGTIATATAKAPWSVNAKSACAKTTSSRNVTVSHRCWPIRHRHANDSAAMTAQRTRNASVPCRRWAGPASFSNNVRQAARAGVDGASATAATK